MYVDQEAVQDDEDNTRTNTNRPPTIGTDVSLFQIVILVCNIFISNRFVQ
jgi:hypothetical protein